MSKTVKDIRDPAFWDEPDLLDDDPAIEREAFAVMKDMGTPPDDIKDPEERKRYEVYLKETVDDGEQEGSKG